MKYYLLIAVIAAASGAAITRTYFQQTKTIEVETVRNNIITETKEVIRTDGTKEVVTVTRDTSTRKSTDTKVVASSKPKWHATITATCSTHDLKCQSTLYGAQLEYNFVGPFSIGVRADTDKQLGIVLGLSF